MLNEIHSHWTSCQLLLKCMCIYISVEFVKNSQLYLCLMIRFLPHYFRNKLKHLLHMRTVCCVIMQFSVFHSFGPVFCLVKLCRHL